MPRIPLAESKEGLDPAGQEAWDFVVGSRGRIVGPYKALLQVPELARRVAHLGTYIRFESSLPGDVRELAIISVARALDCRFEWAAHVVIAREEGVREEAITAVRDNTEAGLTPEEAQVYRYARQLLVNHRTDDATSGALQERFGVQGLVELTATIGFYSLIASTLNGFEIEPTAEMEQLPV